MRLRKFTRFDIKSTIPHFDFFNSSKKLDSHRQKGVLLTAGYRTPTSSFSWCNVSKNKTGFSKISSYIESTSRKSDETCLILSFSPFSKGQFPPDDFKLKEVPCGEGIYFIVCEGEDPI